MTSGVYKRTPEMEKTGKYERTTEIRAKTSRTLTGIPKSPETCAKMSKAGLGVPNTPEHNVAVSEGLKSSDANKAQIESMRGGNDICNHHYIYDHTNPELYTIKVTRSKHQQIHMWMKKAGIKVPHINPPKSL